MKRAISRAAVLLLAFFFMLDVLPASAVQSPLSVSLSGGERGLYITTGYGGDFPSAPDRSKQELKGELDAIVSFAKQYGYSTIYFEAVAEAQAMYRSGKYGYSTALYKPGGFFARLFSLDPLDYLTKQAQREGIAVVAVVDPFCASSGVELPDNKRNLAVKKSEYTLPVAGRLWFDPGAAFTQKLLTSTVKELAKKYRLSGIVLRGYAYPSADFELRTTEQEKRSTLETLLSESRAAAQKARGGIRLGLLLDGTLTFNEQNQSFTYNALGKISDPIGWFRGGIADMLVPTASRTISGGYAEQASTWGRLRAGSGDGIVLPLYNARMLTAAAGEARFQEPFELECQLYAGLQGGLADGCVISGYSALSGELSSTAQSLAAVFSAQPELSLIGFDLEYPREFLITRPAEPITVNTASYYIMGSSDGASPVLLDGEEIGAGRLFGKLVTLYPGRNEFTFTCGDQTQTAVITRGGASGAPASITELRQGTLFPTRQEVTYTEDLLELSCTGPSGAEITASIDGKTVVLEQESPADDGIPARFSGNVRLTDGYPADEVTDLGPVTYTMSYRGTSKAYESTGSLFSVGSEARLAVEVTEQRGDTSSVNTAADFRDHMIGSVEQGARDYVVDMTYSFFQLSCGGWVERGNVSILTGRTDLRAVLRGSPSFSSDEKGETFTFNFGGARPYYLTELTDDTLVVTLYSTTGLPENPDITGSKLFTYAKALLQPDGSTRLTFGLKKRLWGYNVEYHGDEVWIFAKNTPVLSNIPGKPLTGITVVVDAGHGGSDPGAVGAAGPYGPQEKQLNYINSCYVSIRLEQLGATVIRTQTADERLTWPARMDPARDSRADFYICLHHNSTAESVDSTNARGVEVYYMEQLAQPFAAIMAEELSAATGRKNRGDMTSTFRVTQMTHTPSLLVELGFLVSPEEYAELCEPLNIYRASLGIGHAVVRAVREA